MGGGFADRVPAEDPILTAIHLFDSGYVQRKQINVRIAVFGADGVPATLFRDRRSAAEPRHLDRCAAVHFALERDLAQIIRLFNDRFLDEYWSLLFDRLPRFAYRKTSLLLEFSSHSH